MSKPRVVILGGGFGGLATAQALGSDAGGLALKYRTYVIWL